MSVGSDPLGQLAAAEIDRGAMPGAAWWVGDTDGPIAFGCRGYAAVEPSLDPLNADTPFDLASLTKPLATAVLATILDREARFSLDAPLGAVFPELAGTPFAEATLRDAASHRAGLPPWVPLGMSGTTRDRYLARIAACERSGRPGDTLYSDLGYILLGFAIEDAAAAPLDACFDRRIAVPLGLSRCGFPGRGAAFADAAATERGGYYERDLAGAAARPERFRGTIRRGEVHDGNCWALGGVAGHAGLFAPAADVAACAVALLAPQRLGLPADALGAMFRPVVDSAHARTIGFQKAADAESVKGLLPDDAVGHSGFTGTSIWIDADRPRIYVLLTNRVHPTVPAEPFTATRRAFHAIAAAL